MPVGSNHRWERVVPVTEEFTGIGEFAVALTLREAITRDGCGGSPKILLCTSPGNRVTDPGVGWSLHRHDPNGCTLLRRSGHAGRCPPPERAGAAQTARVTKFSDGSSSPGTRNKGEIAGIPTRVIAIGAIVILAVWFLFANLERVKIQFWVFTVTAPLWIALLATLVAGAVLGWLFKGRRSR